MTPLMRHGEWEESKETEEDVGTGDREVSKQNMNQRLIFVTRVWKHLLMLLMWR